MFYKYIFILNLLTIYLFGNTIVDSKVIDGVLYKIIESDAKIMPNFDTNKNTPNGVSLVFKNTQGKVAISKKVYTSVPKHKNNNIKIYYIEKAEQVKQMYEIAFYENDIHILAHEVVIHQYKHMIPQNSPFSMFEPIIIPMMLIIMLIFIGLIIFSGLPNAGDVDDSYKSD